MGGCYCSRNLLTPLVHSILTVVFNYTELLSKALPQTSASTAFSTAMLIYREFLKNVYKKAPIPSDKKFPPTPSKKYIPLVVAVKAEEVKDYHSLMGHTLPSDIDLLLVNKTKVAIEEILSSDGPENSKLVFVEGAPGIGKSTFAWELCRMWENSSCFKEYNLAVLLRLREEKVQAITDIKDLFHLHTWTADSEVKKSLVHEIIHKQGDGLLFILDGFDELPGHLQKKGCIIDLISGTILPKSTIVVTSRPSATAELLNCCRPQIDKHIEILGFTKEKVEQYASSVFSSEELTTKFMEYISACNPAISSLMYIPLNVAIFTEIFRDCGSLQQSLTKLYTELCLTVLNRHLPISVKGFDNLPEDLYTQFLELSRIAFEGFCDDKIIIHSSVSNHFGFMNEVVALYGGGEVSYNFLHLTVQEFFAAFYMSKHDECLKTLAQYVNNKRWNMVWRFYAGLTKFEDFAGHVDFFTNQEALFIQCLYEAETIEHFNVNFNLPPDITTPAIDHNAFDMYALGYCISKIAEGLSWNIWISNGFFENFIDGLKANQVNQGFVVVSTIKRLQIEHCEIDFAHFSPSLFSKVSILDLIACSLSNLQQYIPHLISLCKLDVSHSEMTAHGLLEILIALSPTECKVTALSIVDTDFCALSKKAPEKYFTALKNLIDPLNSGRLKELQIGDTCDFDNEGVLQLVSGQTSLNSLRLNHPCSLTHLFGNACLTKLHINTNFSISHGNHVKDLITIMKTNQSLTHLLISSFDVKCPDHKKYLKALVSPLQSNKTLLSLEFGVYAAAGETEDNVITYAEENITRSFDERFKWTI